jgi:adenylosuccinate lyase
LAVDGCLLIVTDVARGLVVYPRTIEAAVAAELPFMATEEILMAAVQAGGDRQELHETIRRHSLAAAEQVKVHGKSNDLMQRLQADPVLAPLGVRWSEVLNQAHFIGRAPQQAEQYVRTVIDPIRSRYAGQLDEKIQLKV